MSRQLYPKKKSGGNNRTAAPSENLMNRPYHVEYSDPDNPTATTQWGHYSSELEVKAKAWYHCRFLGFTPAATLYSRDELHEQLDKGPSNVRLV